MLHLCIHQNFHNFVTKCDWTRELKTKQQVPVGIDRTLKEDHPYRDDPLFRKISPGPKQSMYLNFHPDFGMMESNLLAV